MAVTDHNRSHLRLLYAVGNPVSPATAEHSVLDSSAAPPPAAP